MDTLISVEPGTGGRFNYTVTTASGYRAVMERCDRDGCAQGWMPSCARPLNDKHMHSSGVGSGSVDLWLTHAGKFCHGWHDARVEAFAATVRRSYGSHKPFTLAVATRKPTAPSWTRERIAEELGITVEEYRAELAKAVA